ncbi:MAG: hypothetical protein NC489_30235 [Ruminococcus flavefaciens]|nr:hypothetical protein [Ruminococcus flavefaciens]
MYYIGDVVQYDTYIGVVVNTQPLVLATQLGNELRIPAVARTELLSSYKDLLTSFERSIINASG